VRRGGLRGWEQGGKGKWREERAVERERVEAEMTREREQDGSRKVDGKHLSGPLGRKVSVIGSTKRIVRVRGIPGGIDAWKEMSWNRRRGSKLKGRPGSRMRDRVWREGEMISNPRGFGGKRMVEGGKEEEFAGKVAKGAEGAEGKG
jgi:hypothetical protein